MFYEYVSERACAGDDATYNSWPFEQSFDSAYLNHYMNCRVITKKWTWTNRRVPLQKLKQAFYVEYSYINQVRGPILPTSQTAKNTMATRDNQETLKMFNNENFTKGYAESAEVMTGHYADLLIKQAKLEEESNDKELIVLDEACGTGVVSDRLVKALSKKQTANLDLTCADFSESMIDFVSRRIRSFDVKSARAVKADAMDTKLPNNKFTHVFLSFGPMVFSDWKVGVAETHRILQPGGTLAMSSWMRLGWREDVSEAFATDPEIPPLPSMEELLDLINADGRWSDVAWITDSVTKSGFVDVDVREVSHTSLLSGVDQLTRLMTGMLGLVQQRTWTAEQREKYKDRATNAVFSYMKQKYGDGEIEWDWVAILTTAKKAVQA